MRVLPWLAVTTVLGACGSVSTSPDAASAIDGSDGDGPGTPIDGPDVDAPGTPIDAPGTPIDAPSAPTPVLYWSMDGTVNNSGALTGYSLTTPAGIGYAPGKFGQAAALGGGQYSYVDGMHASLTTYAKVTIGFWMKESGNTPGQAFLDCNNRSTSPYGGVQMGLSTNSVSVCVSTSTNSFLGGGCNGFTAPSANAWHHWLLRYDGAGTGVGQGAPTEIYVDGLLVHTRANDGANNPVWNPGAPDRLYLGVPNSQLDDVRIYNQVFSPAEQCQFVIRGTWTGTSCTLP